MTKVVKPEKLLKCAGLTKGTVPTVGTYTIRSMDLNVHNIYQHSDN